VLSESLQREFSLIDANHRAWQMARLEIKLLRILLQKSLSLQDRWTINDITNEFPHLAEIYGDSIHAVQELGDVSKTWSPLGISRLYMGRE